MIVCEEYDGWRGIGDNEREEGTGDDRCSKVEEDWMSHDGADSFVTEKDIYMADEEEGTGDVDNEAEPRAAFGLD